MIDVAVFLVLIALSAFFSAAETAYFSLRDSQVRLMERRREWNSGLVARLKSDPQRFLVVQLIGNNVVNATIASLATVLAIDYFDSFGAGIATGFSTIVIILFGELFPKSVAITYRKQVMQFSAIPLFALYVSIYPLSTLFVKLERAIKERFNIRAPSIVSEEEIRTMVELGLEHGEIDHFEREMIENIFSFDDIPVGTVMTPLAKIESLNAEVPVDEIAYFVSQSGFSRFPVYDGHGENFIGYVHTNDVMRVLNSDRRTEPVARFSMPLTRIDETAKIDQVFRLMTKERSHLYLVHAKGRPEKTVGLVTMEDLLEVIVGEIEDEGDKRDKFGRQAKHR